MDSSLSHQGLKCILLIPNLLLNSGIEPFPYNVHIMLKRATNRKDSYTIIHDNTIHEMVLNNSRRFITNGKRLSLPASVVIIIITCLLATSRIITQYVNLYCYTILPPVHSNLMSHHQLSNYAIHGFDFGN